MYCTNCGYKNADTAKFCKSCGADLTEQNDSVNNLQTDADISSDNNDIPEEISKKNTDSTDADNSNKKSLKDKLKTIAIIIVAIITFPLWGRILSLKTSDLIPDKSQDTIQQQELPDGTVVIRDYMIQMTDAFIENDYLVVAYNFTNYDSSEIAYNLAISSSCWQNGVEATEVYYPSYDVNNDMLSVQPGATITIYKVYNIANTIDEVTLTFEPLINFTPEQSAISIDLSKLENINYYDDYSDDSSNSSQFCAADFWGLTIPEVYELTDKAWVLSPDYYRGGRYLVHDKYPYALVFDGGENPTFTETITFVGTSMLEANVMGNICVGQTVSEVMAANPEFEIEYSEVYDPCLSGTFEYNGNTVVIILRFDEYNITYSAEVW